jgi:hypothetical protein
VGVYRIVTFLGATSVTIYAPGASAEAGVPWQEIPVPPYIQEARVALKHSDGSPANLATGALQRFRVVRAGFHRPEVYRMRGWYSTSPSEYVLEGQHYGYGNSATGEWRDLFTPGMVGLPISVSESSNPVNDGEFIITRYNNSGRVAINGGTVDETNPVQKVNFLRAP